MAELFYFFGIVRKERLFAVIDPIAVTPDCIISELDDSLLNRLFEKKKLKLGNFIEEFGKSRGILFGVSRNSQKITEFLKFGRLLFPDIKEKEFGIYFLDNRKCALFKINKHYETWRKIKNDIWKILKPLKLIPKTEFAQKTKDWKEEHGCPEKIFLLKSEKMNLSVGNFYFLFVGIKPKKYNQLKSKIKKAYKHR